MLTFCNICVHFEKGTQKPNNRTLFTLYSLPPPKKKKIIKIELPTKLEKAYGAIFRVGINKIEPLYTTQCISRMNHCAWLTMALKFYLAKTKGLQCNYQKKNKHK